MIDKYSILKEIQMNSLILKNHNIQTLLSEVGGDVTVISKRFADSKYLAKYLWLS